MMCPNNGCETLVFAVSGVLKDSVTRSDGAPSPILYKSSPTAALSSHRDIFGWLCWFALYWCLTRCLQEQPVCTEIHCLINPGLEQGWNWIQAATGLIACIFLFWKWEPISAACFVAENWWQILSCNTFIGREVRAAAGQGENPNELSLGLLSTQGGFTHGLGCQQSFLHKLLLHLLLYLEMRKINGK